jgi:hypothetical protein
MPFSHVPKPVWIVTHVVYNGYITRTYTDNNTILIRPYIGSTPNEVPTDYIIINKGSICLAIFAVP